MCLRVRRAHDRCHIYGPLKQCCVLLRVFSSSLRRLVPQSFRFPVLHNARLNVAEAHGPPVIDFEDCLSSSPPSLLQRPSVSSARSFQTARPARFGGGPFIMMSALRLKSIQYLLDRRAGGNINRNNVDARTRRGHSSSPLSSFAH